KSAGWSRIMIDTLAGAVAVSIASDYIKKAFGGIWNWLWGSGSAGEGRASGILIFGPGGSGKTTFGKLLSAQHLAFLQMMGRYEPTTEVETYSLSDDPSVQITIGPGQHDYRMRSWQELGAAITAGSYRGVMMVGAYGFHSLAVAGGYRKHKLYKNNKAEFL